MATMIVKHKVADYTAWKKVFDELKYDRDANGWIGHEILRDMTDANTVVIVNKVKSIDGAKAHGQSPVLKEAMQRAGVISAPEITYLADEEMASY